MGRVFLDPLFKSWSDMPTHKGKIPPTLWEDAEYPSSFLRGIFKHIRSLPNTL
jgi:hypothetical protein